MDQSLSPELLRMMELRNGGPIEVECQGKSYVIMSYDAYHHLIGLDSNADLDDSVAAIKRGIEDIKAGRTRPMRDVLDEVERRTGQASLPDNPRRD